MQYATDDFGAFVPGARAQRLPTGQGVLSGLSFAVKDLIDVAGAVTGGGNPDWAATHESAAQDAWAVQALRAAGATLVGKTITDELAFSLEGENAHYGTPRNPRAPDRLPGGSSSGSAVAVAAGLADFALGTDTGGSVRVPAAFCGVFGFRPTHGRVSLQGVIPFAPSYDTVGWFARKGAVLQSVGRVLLGAERPAAPLRLLMAGDVFAAVDPDCAEELRPLAAALGAYGTMDVLDGPLRPWLQAYETLQGPEIWQGLGPWITAHRPRFGDNIAPRFARVAQAPGTEMALWQDWRAAQTRRLHALLGHDRAWVMPTTPCPPLLKTAPADERRRFSSAALAIDGLAGHAGLPQVTLPVGRLNGLPLGLSVVGPPGSDEGLLAIAAGLTLPLR